MTKKEKKYSPYCGGTGLIVACDTINCNCHSEPCPRCGGTGKMPEEEKEHVF